MRGCLFFFFSQPVKPFVDCILSKLRHEDHPVRSDVAVAKWLGAFIRAEYNLDVNHCMSSTTRSWLQVDVCMYVLHTYM